MDTSKPRERERDRDRETETETERDRDRDRLYFSTMKILGQRPTHIISAVATVLLLSLIHISEPTRPP